MAAGNSATCEKIDGGYRLANDQFEAVISVAGGAIGVTKLSHRGEPSRQAIEVRELPVKLRLATDAPRIDFGDWGFHAGSGNALQPEEDWGYQLKLHEHLGGSGRVQRITETLLGPPWYTDMYYPGYAWYQQMVTLPKEWEGKPVEFVLGGEDEYDWRAYWVYVNGKRVGRSGHDDTYEGKWHEVPRYVLKPGEAGYGALKFGQANLLAVQARGLDRRTPEMHRLNLERYSGASLLVDQYVSSGEATRDVSGFAVASHTSSVEDGVARVEIVMSHPQEMISIISRYALHPEDAAVHKTIIVRNEGNSAITLLEADVMHVEIGKAQATSGGQGWPVRIGEDWFAGVCHPAGVARTDKTGVRLCVNPGQVLDPEHNHDYASKTAVISVGNGRRAFSDYLEAHGRRKQKFLRMYSLYGLCEIASGLYPPIELTEKLVMGSIDQLAAMKKRGIEFEYYCIDTGWNDPKGDLKTFHPANFPNGPEKALAGVRDLGLKPLLWISPAQGPPAFRFGTQNPLLKPEDNIGASWFLCMAAKRWHDMLRDAMIYHIKSNGVRGFKLDEVSFYCARTNHGHLQNKYGTEAEMDSFIDILNAVKEECPEVLLMLYWRFMSPWWLLHVDTIYQRGLQMEGATPSEHPGRLIRQSVTVSLDQGHDYNWDTMPLIGQDSLGVWLSKTRWGSWMGAEGWREAWIMDFIRGNMMHQLWGDLSFLNEEDLQFMEAIARCTAKNADVLPGPKRILGSPWEQEPYGYVCSKGDRGLIAVNNPNFAGMTARLALDEEVGLSPGKAYEVRWVYKDGSVKDCPVRVVPAGGLLEIELGSFEACLAEIALAGGENMPATMPARQIAVPTLIHTRFAQTQYVQLSWYDPAAQVWLARVMNGRTAPMNNPDALMMGPDRSDERDRDIVSETLKDRVAIPASESASKLMVIVKMDREGIAWHHLAPYLIIRATASGDGKAIKAIRIVPHRMHEQAGAWSWILHEFDLPAGIKDVSLQVDACHPKSVSLSMEVWHVAES